MSKVLIATDGSEIARAAATRRWLLDRGVR